MFLLVLESLLYLASQGRFCDQGSGSNINSQQEADDTADEMMKEEHQCSAGNGKVVVTA